MYSRAMVIDPINPGDPPTAASRERADRAEEIYERAIAAAPNHAEVLGQYAHFLYYVRGDVSRAEAMYERTMVAAPDDALSIKAALHQDRRLFSERTRAAFERIVETFA
jgi:tetratricopeptide (TPR) repeat protein